MKKKALPFLWFIFSPLLWCIAQTPITVQPSTTDAKIKNYDYTYYTYTPVGTPLQKLLVFFPGTDGQVVFYTKFLEKAAKLGYHVVGINYPNSGGIYTYCNSADSNCLYKARLEIKTGLSLSDAVDVDTINCIDHRLQKLLSYLKNNYPNAGWQQFLLNNQPTWDNYCIAGHSQGAAQALFYGKFHQVSRIISFAGLDWQLNSLRPAPWIHLDNETALQNVYAFTHNADELVKINLQKVFWNKYGLSTFGPVVAVDSLGLNMHGSHALVSDRTPSITGSIAHHNAVVVNTFFPMDGQGNNQFEMAWEYLLSVGLSNTPKVNIPQFRTWYHDGKLFSEVAQKLEIFDLCGKKISQINANPTGVELKLHAGIYLIISKQSTQKIWVQ